MSPALHNAVGAGTRSLLVSSSRTCVSTSQLSSIRTISSNSLRYTQRPIIPSTTHITSRQLLLPPTAAAAAAAALTSTWTPIRHSSHSPMGHQPDNSRPKVTLNTLTAMYRKQEPITMLTAYDFPSAHVADHAGMDMILVGDSLAMVALGLEDTSEVTLEEMIMCARAVSRAVSSAFTVGDLPMGSYEISPQQALTTAFRMLKEGRMQSIKLEGGASMAPTIRALTNAGIPVLAHVGLTPQRQHALGGFRVQGKTAASAATLLEDALAVQEAGAFGVVLEAVPPRMAELVTQRLRIPTIGIGAGSGTSGQVLVQVDMLGNYPPGRYLPKFVKRYADVWSGTKKGIEAYRDEVKARSYPGEEHGYAVKEEEVRKFEEMLSVLDGQSQKL